MGGLSQRTGVELCHCSRESDKASPVNFFTFLSYGPGVI